MTRCRKCVFSSLAILLLGCVALSQSKNPVENERIAYEHAPDDRAPWPDLDVYSINADGTNVRPLTNDGHSHSATWSPDGRQILFVHDSTSGQPAKPFYHAPAAFSHFPSELFLMDRDGSNAHLFRGLNVISGAAWSPDDNGSGSRQLTTDPDWQCQHPSWSPDGRKITFFCRAVSAPCGGIVTINPHGPRCVRRIFVIPFNNPPLKLSPLVNHDGAYPVFAPTN